MRQLYRPLLDSKQTIAAYPSRLITANIYIQKGYRSMEQGIKVTPEILEAFGLDIQSKIDTLLSGHINDTYMAQCSRGKFIVQRINHFVFKSPEQIMKNMAGVTGFLREKISQRGGDPSRETLTVHPTVDGDYYFVDSTGGYWRCTTFIENATSYETPDDPSMLKEAGYAFGSFQNMLSDYPADTLYEIIPNFHNTPARFSQLWEAVKNNSARRVEQVKNELEFASARERDGSLLMSLLEDGALPLRVTHNDTKMSNVLIDDNTGKAVCVIDLDTVMPGLTAFDYGDSIRAGASTAKEDETDLSKVNFDLQLFDAYSKGFLSAAGNSLTAKELQTLPDGARLMTFEVGIRFLADYLNGDVYFKTAYPTHNLDRARNQFKLVSDMESKRTEMNNIIKSYC